MTSGEIRKKYLEFFESKGHKIIPSASLVPENDPTTLFTGSGMQPMVPYLLGEKHPLGQRIADSQKCFRAVDIEEVGDNRHTTFFEMLGNWSLGDYFKKEQIPWMFEFLTEEIGLDPHKLFVTVFIGDEKNNIPKDTESAGIWKELFAKKGIEAKEVEIGSEENGYKVGMQDGRIFYYDVKKNWWSRAGVPSNMPAGEPGGPDSEMFYDLGITHDQKFGKECHPNCDCGRFVEIGNNVFMEYKKNEDGTFSKLPQQNVDFGGGLERLAAASEGTSDIFNIDIFTKIFHTIKEKYGWDYKSATENDQKIMRIVADHLRSAIFIIGDGIMPSNTDRGYMLRRLIRRAVYKGNYFARGFSNLHPLTNTIVDIYKDVYRNLEEQKQKIHDVLEEEETKFIKTLNQGLREFKKISVNFIDGQTAFNLYQTYGFPIELTVEIAKEKGISVDLVQFEKLMEEHRQKSRDGSEQKFKGGLGGHSDMEVKYHTATHLLRQALEEVLGEPIVQKGSNITPERLRFDFTLDRKMTDGEKKKVEDIVNEKIKENLPMNKVVMKKEEAEKTGATHVFGEKYGDEVSIYYVGDSLDSAWSKEFCGGPHISNTGELGNFKILKEEAVAAGIRRIKAILE